jgi:hypothetical protein
MIFKGNRDAHEYRVYIANQLIVFNPRSLVYRVL